MVTKRIQYLKIEQLRGELLEVVNEWDEHLAGELFALSEMERLTLVNRLIDYLTEL